MLTDANRIIEVDKQVVCDISDVNWSLRLFTRLSAKRRRFTKVDFKYTVFDACYLRDCTFDSCDFTGCRFLATNLHGSAFDGCDFSYAQFERTLIDSAVLDTCCPPYENLKSRFARSLRVNFQSIGDAQGVNKAASVELSATEIHLHKAWRSNESYYRKKYKGIRRAKAFASWATFWILDFLWGNGESARKLVRTALVAVLAIALCDTLARRDPLRLDHHWQALIEAPQFFLGTQPPPFPGIVTAGIALLRLVIIGLFISILVRRFARR